MSSSKKWIKRYLENGTPYYTIYNDAPVVQTVIPKEDTPEGLARAMEEHPDFYVESGKILVRRDWRKGAEGTDELPPGIYRFTAGGFKPPRLEPCALRDDTYIPLSKMYDSLAQEVRDYLNSEKIYQSEDGGRGVLHNLGILMVGPPGNGKTTMIRQLIHEEIPDDGIAVFMKYIPAGDFLEVLDSSTRGRIKVPVFEELAATLCRNDVDELLDFFDGESTMDKTLTIATSNYPWLLPPAILDRSGRFDLLVEINNPDEDQRKEFLEGFGGIKVSTADITQTSGLSVADLREVVLYSERRKLSLQEAISALRTRKETAQRLRRTTNEDSWFGKSADMMFSTKRYTKEV